MALSPEELARKAAAKIQNDPAIAAINDLGESMEKSVALIEGEQKAHRRLIEEKFAATENLIEQTRTEMAVGQKLHADRINTLDRRSIALGLNGSRDIEGLALAALGEKERRDISLMNFAMSPSVRGREDLPILSNPVGATLVAHWLHASMKLQRRKFNGVNEERELETAMARYEKAFADMYPHETAADLGSNNTNMGGNWLPAPVAAELWRLVSDNSILSPQAMHIPMNSKTLVLPTEGSSGITVNWGTENAAITDSMPASNATSSVTLTANRLQGFATCSIEELQDSAISILAWVQARLTELMGREIDRVLLEGNATGDTSANTVVGIGSLSTINIITATNAIAGEALTYADLVKLVFKARERSTRDGAKFFMAPEGMSKVVGLVDTTGQPIVQFGNVPNQFAASILGYPCEVHSVIRADRTVGTGTALCSNIYFGPPKQFLIGERAGMAWDVTDIASFSKYQINMRLIARVGLGVAVPKAFSRREGIQI